VSDPDPDDWQPKPLMGRMFWIMLALSVVCVAAGAAVALLAPRFLAP
jgi:hypothetical protein